jgi:hypothetical protein
MPSTATVAAKPVASKPRSALYGRSPINAPAPSGPRPERAPPVPKLPAPALPAFIRPALAPPSPASSSRIAAAKGKTAATKPRAKLALLTPKGQSRGSGQHLAPHIQEAIENSLSVDLISVRIHSDAAAQEKAQSLSARAFTFGSDIFLGKGEHPSDLGLLAHETVHVVQQQAGPVLQKWSADGGDRYEREANRGSSAVLHGESFSVHERTSAPRVQRWGLSDALSYFAEAANNIPGYRMFTLVIGVNPINMQRVERNAANLLRAAVEFIPGGALITQALDKYGILERVGTWVQEQLDTLGISGSTIKKSIDDFLGTLHWTDIADLGGVWERAKQRFADPIERVKNFLQGLLEGIWKLVRDAILKPIASLAESSAGWGLLTAVLGKNPITGEAVPRTPETLIGGFMKLIHEDEIWENIQRANAGARAWAWFQKALSGLLGFVSEIPSLFLQALKSLEWSDILNLPGGFLKVAKVFGNFLVNFTSWAGNTIWDLLQIIFEVVAPGVMPYLKKVGAAFKSILKNPIGFVGNLVKAAMLGFQNFAVNFGGHLKAGLIDWLTGSLPGVYIPKAFELGEIVKFVFSVLGISWQNIRQKLVKVVGEPAVKAMETGFEIVVTLFTKGPAAAWDKIKDQLANLRDMVIGGITDFVVDMVVKKAVPKIVAMFIPGAGFISAIVSIYETIMVFINKLQKIIQVVTAFVDSIVAIAGGAIGAAANRVESTLAGLLSLAINFLAGFAGLGKVADKVMGVIKKVQATVDKALDWLINWIVTMAKKLFARVFGKSGKEAQPELDAAVQATEKLVDENPSLEGAAGQLAAIKKQYGLTRLDVRRTSQITVEIEAEINPRKKETRKLTPAQRLKDCIKRDLHGNKVKIEGSGSPERATELAEINLRQLRANQTKIMSEIRLAEIRLTAQERLARSRGVEEADLMASTQTGRNALQRARSRLEGVEAGIAGIEHEEHVAKKEKPNLRNVIVICVNCENVIQEFDMIKDKTILEAKISVDAVKVEQVKREQDIANKLWGDVQVELALPAGPNVEQQVKEKFKQAGEVPTKVRQY